LFNTSAGRPDQDAEPTLSFAGVGFGSPFLCKSALQVELDALQRRLRYVPKTVSIEVLPSGDLERLKTI
jgi:hypothetical protein